ncbi:hypothetical protein HUA78_16195 [Myxococcus sp. CA033]|uniref:hypothetical protein n=1 Tax=Myxococcus sp. CA033 TaxID=2741516 RepID=UPI00157B4AB8|nr:hypothetical protein [Myxococcus sp. CA033]NTX35988.1 hypothetical protein [Myxococcus sp. CA033]
MLKKMVVSWILLVGSTTLFAACDSEQKKAEVIDSHGTGTVVLLIERETGEGPYVEGTQERFKVTAAGEVFKAVRWSANAGVVAAEAERVTWTLPKEGTASLSVSVETESGKTAEGSFNFSVVASAVVVPVTGVDAGPDVTGVLCELAFDNAGKGHLVYTNETHRGLWYATWDGTTWTTEQIDGPGFNNGGTYVLNWNIALTLDVASGTPHVVYLKGPGLPGTTAANWRMNYATRVNGSWVREEVEPTNRTSYTRVSVALNPNQGLQPTVVFSDGSAGTGVRVATRTAPGTWGIAQHNMSILMGDVNFDASGALYIPSNANSSSDTYVSVRPGAATDRTRLDGVTLENTLWLSAVWGPSQHLLLLSSGGVDGARSALQDITVKSPITSSTLATSPVDFENDSNDMTYGGGKVFIAQRHGTKLELIAPDARGFWTYTQLGTVQEGSRPSVAVRPTDSTPHVCYQRDGKVSFQ